MLKQDLIERLMEVNRISRAEAEKRATRVTAASRRGTKLLRERKPAVPMRRKRKPVAAVPKRRRWRTSWTRAGRIYLRLWFVDRGQQAVYRGSDGNVYSQKMVEESIENGAFKVSSRRKTKGGHTLTVLARRI